MPAGNEHVACTENRVLRGHVGLSVTCRTRIDRKVGAGNGVCVVKLTTKRTSELYLLEQCLL